jgi:cysteinyl-tRNA synthetase
MTVHGRGAAYWRQGGATFTLDKDTPIPVDDLRTTKGAPRTIADVAACAPSDLDEIAARAAKGGPDALTAIAQLLKRAHEGGEDRIDPAPLVEGVLQARQHARDARQFELADELRNALVAADIEVQDSPEGVSWTIRGDGH